MPQVMLEPSLVRSMCTKGVLGVPLYLGMLCVALETGRKTWEMVFGTLSLSSYAKLLSWEFSSTLERLPSSQKSFLAFPTVHCSQNLETAVQCQHITRL